MTIGAWGDSITYGESDTEALGWPGRLRKTFPSDGSVRVYNRGVCGDTSEGLLARFSTEAKAIEPDLILIAIGINDSKFPPGSETNKVPLEAFRVNVEAILDQALTHTKQVFVIGATKTREGNTGPGSRFVNAEIERYNNVLKELATLRGLPFIDMFEVFDTETDLFEGLHPNAAGYEKMVAHIKTEAGL